MPNRPKYLCRYSKNNLIGVSVNLLTNIKNELILEHMKTPEPWSDYCWNSTVATPFRLRIFPSIFPNPWTENWFLYRYLVEKHPPRWQGVSEHSKPKLASENSFTKRVVGSKVNFKETRLKVSKFQNLIFCSHFLQKTNENIFLYLP